MTKAFARRTARDLATAQPPALIKKQSRAVVRLIEPGNEASCTKCGEPLKWRARKRLTQIICNVYKGRRWNRVEYYHPKCYKALDEPYGEPVS